MIYDGITDFSKQEFYSKGRIIAKALDQRYRSSLRLRFGEACFSSVVLGDALINDVLNFSHHLRLNS